MTAPAAIPDVRWMLAQEGEREWWLSADRSHFIRELAPWYAELLQITPEAVTGKTVLDLGGGPLPLVVLLKLPVHFLTVVDPLATLFRPDPLPNVSRVTVAAEDYIGGQADEVWGYNVLQHVIDPAAVLETAKRHALRRIRWFDWTDTKREKHHPHSIKADWLVAQFAGWRLVSERRGYHTGHQQHYVALIADRLTPPGPD